MWRVTTALLGRWGTRDFLRGRNKNAGSVHIRHTHGSKGRYKRLSTLYGIRDGRRHAGNRLHGGLGVKLGGGLFGMRLPRQHLLSTMTPEEYDLEVYGHPNITNPYRDHLSEHPALQSVLDDAAMAVQLVVLLPRVARRSDKAAHDVVPETWDVVAREVRAAVGSFVRERDDDGCSTTATQLQHDVTVHLATLQASVCLGNTADPASTTSALAQLYALHSQGHRVSPHELITGAATQDKHASHLPSPVAHKRPVLPFLCSAMKVPTHGVTCCAPSSTRPADMATRRHWEYESGLVCTTGVLELLRALRHDAPDALCLCTRLHSFWTTRTPRDADTHVAMPATGSEGTPRCGDAPARRGVGGSPLLKKDVDRDETAGVWGLARIDAARLVRWHYMRNDPRAHCGDALPHRQRCLPVILFVDASKMSPPPCSAKEEGRRRVASLLPRRFSQELAAMGYRPIVQEDMRAALRGMREWTTEHHTARLWLRTHTANHAKV